MGKLTILSALAALLFLIGCKAQQPRPVFIESTRTEETALIDTVLNIDAPKEKAVGVVPFIPPCPDVTPTPSDTSKIETSLARSWAWFDGARLNHTLENKSEKPIPTPAKIPEKTITVEKPVPYPVYVDKPVDVPVRLPLRWWEKLFFWVGVGSTAIFGFKFAWKIKKRLPI